MNRCRVCGTMVEFNPSSLADLSRGHVCLACDSQGLGEREQKADLRKKAQAAALLTAVAQLLGDFQGRMDLLVTSETTDDEKRTIRHFWETADRLRRGIVSLANEIG